MKTVILAGGLGTRISEETILKPKPMIEIGGMPILWHIMKIYSTYGFNDFIVCLGYKGFMIKEFFASYPLHTSDVTIDLREDRIETHRTSTEPWSITLVDTGDSTMTGGRIRRIEPYVRGSRFMLTYGDGLADVDLRKLLEFHISHGKTATLTAVRPPARFGSLEFSKEGVIGAFKEKPLGDGSYVNGGFFVLEPEIFGHLKDDRTVWEKEPLEALSSENQLMAFRHDGFWFGMDSARDRAFLEEQWAAGKAKWKVWR